MSDLRRNAAIGGKLLQKALRLALSIGRDFLFISMSFLYDMMGSTFGL